MVGQESERKLRTLLMSTQIVRGELHISDSEFLRCCKMASESAEEESRIRYILGWRVGCNVASLSFFSMCNSV